MTYTLEYYHRPFYYFNKELVGKFKPSTVEIRKDFWSLIPDRTFSYLDGRPLLNAYLNSLEIKIKQIVEQHSIVYWLHLGRRILPYSLGTDKTPATISSIRNILNSAIQKYGQREFCNSIGKSKEINVSQIFNGLLMADEFEIERALIEASENQIVFTNFTHINLLDYYKLEMLCYEVWFCGAKMRGIQKGALLEIDQTDSNFVKEYRSDELEQLIINYDTRSSANNGSATGTIFTNDKIDRESDIFLPVLNASNAEVNILNETFEALFNVSFGENYIPNFLLIPFPLKKYGDAHSPFHENFKKKNGLSFDSILFVIASLCCRYIEKSMNGQPGLIVKIIQRGYEGPVLKSELTDVILSYTGYANHTLQQKTIPSKNEIITAVEFLTCNNSVNINILNPGTLKIFLPVGEERLYIDYSIIHQVLHNLFFGIDLNPYTFRGKTLEDAFSRIERFLPIKPLENKAKQSKQVDFSVKVGNVLVLGECKVVAMSLGYYNGDIKAFNHRIEKVVKKGLTQADDKARWLSINPIGKNFDLDGVDYILPVAISAFKEFIPSLNSYYWIDESTPRVLTIEEVIKVISKEISLNTFNLIKVIRS